MANPFDRAIFLAVTVKVLGVSRKVDTDQVEVNTDKDLLRVSKKILACEEYDAIKKSVTELKKFLKSRTVPGVKFVKGGIYPVPNSRLEEVDARVEAFKVTYGANVNLFLDVYETRKTQGINRLADLGDEEDYPSLAKVRRSFGVDTRYISIGPPASMQSVSREIFDRENERLKSKFEEAAVQVQDAMRTMFADLLSHAAERLQPGEDGKKKRFNATLVDNLKDFMDTFADRNITGDADLERLVNQMKMVLDGRDAEQIRKNSDIRALVTEQVADVKAKMDRMLSDRPSRSITIDDAEDETNE